ncbi:MAG TPA: MarR family transcriptional regulator [Alphaproteobacteria bacterium]|nr:MarR family transcriptional regulator [Alphaproteobacteria bacterium]
MTTKATARRQAPPEPVESRESAERNVGFLLNDAARLMRINYDRRMRELGLTRAQWWVLTHLYFNEGISQSELSAILEVERATLGRLLDRLEAKGWVERRPDAGDRRVKRVFLTREVGGLLVTMRALARELRAEALAGLTAAEQEAFIATLLKLKGNLLAMLDGGRR